MEAMALWKWVRNSLPSNGFGVRPFINVDEISKTYRDSGFQVRIMNYHSIDYPTAVTQNLYCDILKDQTPKTCRESWRLLQVAPTTATNQKESLKPKIIENKGSELYAYDDAIVLEAAKLGWIETSKLTREQARQDLMKHHTKILQKGFTDLPLMCPSRAELEMLLQKSLKLEQIMWPQLYDSSSSTRQSLEDAKVDHVQQFWKLADQKRGYCAVDTDLLFNNVNSYEQLMYESMNRTWESITGI